MNIPKRIKKLGFSDVETQMRPMNYPCPNCKKGSLFTIPYYTVACNNPDCSYKETYL